MTMSSSGSPLVSVVIPVYNGERFIADAIRSVLAQTYDNFELTIANNCSTDRTAAIAEEFARNDPRVRVYNATEFVSVVDSHNRAFSLISDDAVYCKVLGADDLLFPNCLSETVRVAEAHPTVGMVAALFLLGSRVNAGAPFPKTFFSGREICRLRLLNGVKLFGAPCTSLFRASVVRAKRPFYDPVRFHGDTDACMSILQHHDFGFVYQVLSYSRHGEGSPTTAYLDRVNSYPAAALDEVLRWGPVYLTPDEYAQQLRAVTHEYYTLLARRFFELGSREFWDFHLNFARTIGYRINGARFGLYAAMRVVDVALNPLRTTVNVTRRLSELLRANGQSSEKAPAPSPVPMKLRAHSASGSKASH